MCLTWVKNTAAANLRKYMFNMSRKYSSSLGITDLMILPSFLLCEWVHFLCSIQIPEEQEEGHFHIKLKLNSMHKHVW